ncbi:MAG TPA: DUF4468 domain-containing protein [Puia sp.]|nr:DUF4468 domain-containing protein [Puia sp.]
MKANILLLALSLPVIAGAQKMNPDTLSFNYSGIVQVDSTAAKVLQARARAFVAESFASGKEVVQLDDSEAGILVIKGTIAPIVKVPLLGKIEYGYVHFTAKWQFKDGRYKYALSEFTHEAHEPNMGSGGALTNRKPACGTFTMTEGQWRQIKANTNDRVIEFIDRLRAAMREGNREDF